jgi:organic radical activating enzyme
MNQFNERFYALLDQGENNNNNLIELLILLKSPGIKMDIETKIVYVIDLVYQYYEDATVYEKEQINKLLEFIDKQLKFDNVSYEEFEDLIFYKQQLDYLEEEDLYDERDDRTCMFGYNCGYECEGFEESFY